MAAAGFVLPPEQRDAEQEGEQLKHAVASDLLCNLGNGASN